jgi:hypothetical protein
LPFPEKIFLVATWNAALRQHDSDVTLSRMEAYRMATMAWLQARQARQAPVPHVSSARAGRKRREKQGDETASGLS